MHEPLVWGNAHFHMNSSTGSALKVVRLGVACFHHWMVSAPHCCNDRCTDTECSF